MSFWRRLFGRTEPARSEARHALSMVMLPDATSVSGSAVLDRLAATWADLPPISDIDAGTSTTVARIPGGALAVAQMPVPIPPGELEGPVALAWHWPQAAELVSAHRSHVIVHMASTEIDQLDLRLFHTKLVAATLAASAGVGVYVGDAMLVRSAGDYAEDALTASRECLPILSWIGFNAVADGDAHSAYTTGLSAFGQRELEVRRTTRSWANVAGTLADLAHYQLASGRTIGHGETFGATDADRTRVRFAKSEFITGADVAVLELS